MQDLIERLHKQIIPEPNSGCWIWIGGATSSRSGLYGCFRFNGSTIRAHRAAWLAYRGEIPKGLLVCHKCDNTLCCNPDHLFLGTVSDNNKDRRRKKRDAWFRNPKSAKDNLSRARKALSERGNLAKGERNGASKLDEKAVREIRELSKKRIPQRIIAAKYNVSQPVIWSAINRKTWAHVT